MPRVDEDHAVEVMRRAELDPLVPYPGAHTPWPSTCLRCGQPRQPQYSAVSKGAGGCKPCGHRWAHEKRRRAFEATAIDIFRSKGFEPLVPYPGAQVPWRARCLVSGAVVAPMLHNVRKRPHSCSACNGNIPPSQEEARLALASHAWVPDPNWRYTTAHALVPGTCTRCGTHSPPGQGPSYNNMMKGQGPCLPCGGRMPVDQQTAYDECVRAGWLPADDWVYVNVETPIPGSCLSPGCTHATTDGRGPRLATIRKNNGRAPCPGCAEHGIDYDAPGVFYVVTDGDIVKCGIANETSAGTRLKTHHRQGLNEVMHVTVFDRCEEAARIEARWRHHVRAHFTADGAWPVPRDRLRDGYQEAMPADDDTWDFIVDLLTPWL